MRVIKAPPIIFKCDCCGATCEGDADEFTRRNTMPPTWTAECGYCHALVQCSPSPLISKEAAIAGRAFGERFVAVLMGGRRD